MIDTYKPLFDASVQQWQNGSVDNARSTVPSVPGSIPSNDNQFSLFFNIQFLLAAERRPLRKEYYVGFVMV